MRLLNPKPLMKFSMRHPDAKGALMAWREEVRTGEWASPADVKARYASASILRDNRIVFNIKGNTYRLVAHVNYGFGTVYIRFLGTHAEYDKINAEEV